MLKHKKLFWLGGLVAALAFDVLFWKKPFGISFFIWTVVLLVVGFVLARLEEKKPVKVSWALALLILGFAFVPAWRTEPFTRFITVALTFAGMLLLTATFLNGHWPFFRLVDYITEMMKAVFGGLSGAILFGSRFRTPAAVGEEHKKKSGKGWAILRGVLIALPVVSLFAVLLSSADPVFGDWLKRILDLEKLPEYLFRLWYVLIIGSFLVGIYLHALYPNKEAAKPETMNAWMKPFLGWTETGIILGAIDALFIAFVIIQVRYLFGGTANITETGYTFAEYARRGFGELVAVAVLSLMVYLGLSTISKRETRGARAGFSIVSILLMVNVLVMLASSLQRLLLYEGAYGFSELRTYTHVFIYWLAALIVVTIVLEILRQRGRFALALLVAGLGFAITLTVMNVDGFIVRQNVARTAQGEDLDFNYLQQLGTDAVPAMVTAYQQTDLPQNAKDVLGSALACRTVAYDNQTPLPWQGFTLSGWRADTLIKQFEESWSNFKVTKDNELGDTILVNGKQVYCSGYDVMD